MKALTIDEAIRHLKNKEIVAIPTETVYGLAADARCDEAVGRVFVAKGRPSDNPLIVHIGDASQLQGLVAAIPEKAQVLMDAFWPGPLSIIFPTNGTVSRSVTAGLSTVAVRMPNEPLTLALLKESGIPLAAPSANLSGKPSPTKPEHVIHDLTGKIVGYLDGGACLFGLESTVIDTTVDPPVILRPGGVTKDAIESTIGPVRLASFDVTVDTPTAPGMKYAHYAPDGDLFLVDGKPDFIRSLALKYENDGYKVGILCEDTHVSFYDTRHAVVPIDKEGSRLYEALRSFDDLGVDVIFCEFFEDFAVMNRLFKASKERILSEVEN